MKWNKLYKYPPSTRSLVEGNRHYDVSNEILPSVTTILQNTQSDEKKASLSNWRQKVGEKEANRIRDEAARRGTAMHEFLEMYLHGEKLLDLRSEGQAARSMGRTIIEQGLKELKEVWGSEVTLFYPGLFAGQTDLVGTYAYEDSIIDFKTSSKPKRSDWILDYKLQMAAYALAHNQVYGTAITQGVILMVTPDNYFQKFITKGREFIRYQHEFLARVDQYYKLKG